jgi:antirestriction protein ArdC
LALKSGRVSAERWWCSTANYRSPRARRNAPASSLRRPTSSTRPRWRDGSRRALSKEPSFDPHAQAEAFVRATGARVRYGFNVSRYRGDLDDIEMPSPAWFTGSSTSTSLETYYATLLHELTHWSGAKHRLDRDMGTRFGDETYAFEELVAELGAAFLCAELGIANEPRPDHAAYLAGWLAVLKRDKKAIFLAARKAQEAMDYLFGLAEMSAKLQC